MPFSALLPFLPALAGGVSGIAGMIGNRNSRQDALAAQDRANAHAGAQRDLAINELNKIPGIAQSNFNPYIQRGQQAQDLANTQFNRMSANPMGFLDEITSGYKPSSGYQFREKKALEAARNSAAAGGLSGTGFDQREQAELVNGILGQDMQQYLANVLGIQGSGLAGQMHEADRGYNASSQMADMLATNQSQLAGVHHGGSMFNRLNAMQQGRNASDARAGQYESFGGLMGALGSLGGKNGPTADQWSALLSTLGFGSNDNQGAKGAANLNTNRGVAQGTLPGRVPNQIGQNGMQLPWPLRRGG